MESRNNKVLLVGTGYMAREYLKVLVSLENEVVIVGRNKEKIQALQKDYSQFKYFSGGLDKFLEHNLELPQFAINATSINQLKITSLQLLEAGIKNLLLEKPGDITLSGLNEINQKAKSCSWQSGLRSPNGIHEFLASAKIQSGCPRQDLFCRCESSPPQLSSLIWLDQKR